MNKELAVRALDSAFVTHVDSLFSDLADAYTANDGKAAEGPRNDFLARFHAAKCAHDDASAALETTAPAHESAGPETDDAYRARIVAIKPPSASMSAGQLRSVSGAELDSYGVRVGVPRGEAKWSPPAPKPAVDEAEVKE
jgi:hypothetical protein